MNVPLANYALNNIAHHIDIGWDTWGTYSGSLFHFKCVLLSNPVCATETPVFEIVGKVNKRVVWACHNSDFLGHFVKFNSLLVLILVIFDHAFGAEIITFLKIKEHVIYIVYPWTIFLRTFKNLNFSLAALPTIFAFDFFTPPAHTFLPITAVKTFTFLFEGTLAFIAPLCQCNLLMLLVMHFVMICKYYKKKIVSFQELFQRREHVLPRSNCLLPSRYCRFIF